MAELWLSCGSLTACGIPFGIGFGVAFGVNQVSAGTEDVNTTRQSLRTRIRLMQQISSKLPKNCAFRPPAVLTRLRKARLVNLLTAQLELQFTELARLGVLRQGGGHHSPLQVTESALSALRQALELQCTSEL